MIFNFRPVVNVFDICSNGVEHLYFCVDQFFRAIAIRAVEHHPSRTIKCENHVIILKHFSSNVLLWFLETNVENNLKISQ
jgi:hypothetical protein